MPFRQMQIYVVSIKIITENIRHESFFESVAHVRKSVKYKPTTKINTRQIRILVIRKQLYFVISI